MPRPDPLEQLRALATERAKPARISDLYPREDRTWPDVLVLVEQAQARVRDLEEENDRLESDRERLLIDLGKAYDREVDVVLRAEKAEAELERLHSWAGLMELLDEHRFERDLVIDQRNQLMDDYIP